MIQDTRYKIQERGFTLIEILVVVAIIGVLSSLILVGLNTARKQGRDARRVADLRQVQTGLELYFQSKSEYPNQSTWLGMTSDLKSAGIGVTNIPNDPLSNAGWSYGYCIIPGDTSGYAIGAYIEDPANSALKQGVTVPCSPTVVGPSPLSSCSYNNNTVLTQEYCQTL